MNDILNKKIKEYVKNDTYSSALLINGKWGSGKTYYIENELISYISNKEEMGFKITPIYISLYGVSRLSEISKQIFNRITMFFKWKKDNKKANYFVDVAKGTVKNLLRKTIFNNFPIEIVEPEDDSYWKYIDEQKAILILDDLERSKIDIIELLGYVNNFVEEYGIKTIIIANEEEIKNKIERKNIEQKYNVIKNLKLPIKSDVELTIEDLDINEKYNKEDESGTIKTHKKLLDYKVDYLFSNPTDYDLIKEKLISHTYDYEPNLENIFKKLGKNVLSKEQTMNVINLYNRLDHKNIRTFLFSLELIKEIKNIIKNSEIKNKDKIEGYLVETLFYQAIIIKDNLYFSGFDQRSLDFSFDRAISKELGEELNVVISNYINNSILDVEPIENIINHIDEALIENENNISLVRELDVYWRMFTDEELIVKMKKTKDLINNSHINIFDYKSLLRYMFTFNEIFIDNQVNIENTVEKMIEKINDADYEIDNNSSFRHTYHNYSFDEKSESLFAKYIKQLDDALKANVEKHLKNTLKLTQGNDKEWVDILIEKINKNEYYGAGKSIISKIDIVDLTISLDESDAEQVHAFNINVLRGIYNFSNLKDIYYNDLTPLTNLLTGVETILDSKPKKDNYLYLYTLNQTKLILEEVITKLS